MGLGFYMRWKLLNVHIPDLAHLAKKVRQTEIMKKEKEKYRNEQRSKCKPFTRKEKVAYEEFDFETEVDLAELKKGPPYVCSLLKKLPSSEKSNDSKLKSGKKYSFDISKSDHIFDAFKRSKTRMYLCVLGVFSGLEIVKNFKGVIICIDAILSGGIEQRLKINMPSIEDELGVTQEEEVEERVSMKTYPKEIPSPIKMEKGKAVAQSSGVDKNKDVDVDEEYFDEGDDDMVGTISIIPTEYLGECKSNPDEDYDQEDEVAFSFIRIEDKP
ncbi:hypothetical protein Ahy_A01g001980 [Arachis hypogaea]|uniref:Uncharacterized protein n=1 Tax=Arachis hypogaea TaxID=3818 RepID=A0A445EQ08_ARAHY|nr:hypothetical protein Ahy_A01g001980 [Arachis hypogaea]